MILVVYRLIATSEVRKEKKDAVVVDYYHFMLRIDAKPHYCYVLSYFERMYEEKKP